MDEIVIIGGGIAGLVCASLLSKEGIKVTVVEKQDYPKHKVCGEYISNEVRLFLTRNSLFPENLELPAIHNFLLTSVSGKSANAHLQMGGFGISRYRFDEFLYRQALHNGAKVITGTRVNSVDYIENRFLVSLNNGDSIKAKWVIGAHGKRSMVDKKLNRPFFFERNDFLGVKYHIKTEFDPGTIALHNFEGGYCGISRVEAGIYNLCYLGSRSVLRKHGSIEAMESNVLMKNPFLKHIFEHSDFLFNKPFVINEISFRKKLPVENHILMTGDAAGLITPLCGNGMAMAIHSAKILSETFLEFRNKPDRSALEQVYARRWQRQFSSRLWFGRLLQNHLFGGVSTSNLAISILKQAPPLARWIIKKTHGNVL